MAAHESASMAALRRNGRAAWPGMTIFGIGDEEHQDQVSDHNPDDTAGVRAGQTDADAYQEWRALDFMIGPVFTATQADRLVTALTTVEASRQRLFYVIYRDRIYRRANGFAPQVHTGTFHGDHVHVSGLAADDENGADWPAVLALGGAVALEADLNAYWEKYEGGPGETTEAIRTNRENARLTITGSPNLAADVAALGVKLDLVLVALAQAPGGLVPHTHEVTGSTGDAVPVVEG